MKQLRPLDIVNQAYIVHILTNFFLSLRKPIATGVNGKQIERFALQYFHKRACKTVIKGYKNFPSHISICRNEILAHGIPDEEVFVDDDIITIDIVIKKNNLHADMAWSFGVGKMSEESKYLLQSAWKVSRAGVCATQLGNTFRDISDAVQRTAEKCGVHVYTEFTGHAIGYDIHEVPKIHYNKYASLDRIRSGMVLCIEPIISIKKQGVKQRKNGEYYGSKGYKSAVFEHMVAIFGDGAKVLSCRSVNAQRLSKIY